MDIYAFLLCSAFLLICIHFFINTIKFNKRLPPGPTGLPVVGSLLSIGKRPHESLANLAQTYGPLITVKFGMLNVVIASSAEMAKEILQKNDHAFMGRPVLEAVAAERNYQMSMIWSSGQSPHWKKLRKICHSQLFTTQRLDALRELRHLMIKNMIVRVDEAREEGEPLHVRRLAFSTTLNFLSNTFFSGDMFDMRSDAAREFQELLAELMELSSKANLADFLPFLRPFDPQGIRRRVTVLNNRLQRIFDDIIRQRIRQRANESDKRGDFLDILLDHSEEHGDQELSYLNIKILITDFFVAGTHTTTTTMEWAMAELLRHPAVLAKAKPEISKNIPPRKLIQEQEIPHLLYVDAVIKEAMRLHPVAPLLLPHRAEQQVEIHGYTIPKNTQVFVNIWSILRDSAHWDDPISFKPERFLNSDTDIRGRDCKYIPFGAGRRICPGSNLAIRMLNLMLANLMHSFDWELPNGLKLEEMDMRDGYGLSLEKYEPLVAIPVNACIYE